MLNPYRYFALRRPTAEDVPGLRGGGRLIVFDDSDRPVLPRHRPASHGEVRMLSLFARSDDDSDWWWQSDQGCSDEWLASHPDTFLGELQGQITQAGLADAGRSVRYVVWTTDREVLRDEVVDSWAS